MSIQCHVTAGNFCLVGLMEGQPGNLPIASSLYQPGESVQIVPRCINPTEQHLTLKVGSTIATFTGVEVDQVEDRRLGLDGSGLEASKNSGVGKSHRNTYKHCIMQPKPQSSGS